MITLPLSQEQKEYTAKELKKNGTAHRGTFDGSYEHQFTGLLAEVAFADAVGLERPTTKKGFDNGVDFVLYGLNFDLKTVGRNYDPKMEWANNLVASQMKYATDAYLFASINKKKSTITFTGMISKADALMYPLNQAGDTLYRDDGKTIVLKADHREIPNRHLHSLNSWSDLHRFSVTVEKYPSVGNSLAYT